MHVLIASPGKIDDYNVIGFKSFLVEYTEGVSRFKCGNDTFCTGKIEGGIQSLVVSNRDNLASAGGGEVGV